MKTSFIFSGDFERQDFVGTTFRTFSYYLSILKYITQVLRNEHFMEIEGLKVDFLEQNEELCRQMKRNDWKVIINLIKGFVKLAT